MAHIVKEKVNNLRWTVRWENSELPRDKNISLNSNELSASISFSLQPQPAMGKDAWLHQWYIFIFLPVMYFSQVRCMQPFHPGLGRSDFNILPYPAGSWIKNFDPFWLSFLIYNFMFQTGLYFMKQNILTLACNWPFAFGEMTVKISLPWPH